MIHWSLAVWPDWAIFCTLGNFFKLLATISLPKSLTFLGNFCKGVKIYPFSSEIIFGIFLQTFDDFYLVTLVPNHFYSPPELLCRVDRFKLCLGPSSFLIWFKGCTYYVGVLHAVGWDKGHWALGSEPNKCHTVRPDSSLFRHFGKKNWAFICSLAKFWFNWANFIFWKLPVTNKPSGRTARKGV